MHLSDHEIEIIKAFSTIWRKSPDCCPFYEENKDAENHIGCDDPLDYLRLSEEEQKTITDWIDHVFDPDEDSICPESSYSLKHIYERDTEKYLTNGQFKGAMVQYGFDPVDPRELNCHYRIKIRFDVLKK